MQSTGTMELDQDTLADLARLILSVAREVRYRGYDDDRAQALSHSEAHVMSYIDDHPGVTPSAVAAGTGLQRSNLSAALRALQQRGFVERRIDPADGRGVNLFPTRAAAHNLTLIRAEWARHLTDALGGDRRGIDTAIRLLTRLEKGLAYARQR
jgi:DNA-binding MarR family transcriptional regulator